MIHPSPRLVVIAVCFAVTAGCASLLGIEDDYQPLSSGGAGGAGGASAGSGGTPTGVGGVGGAGGATGGGGTGGSGCHDDSIPPGGACPPECTGGCNGATCVFLCDELDECRGNVINCPDGFACEVQCTATNACRDAAIVCQDSYACTISCDADSACRDATITCPDAGTCELTCGGFINGCGGIPGTTLDCGQKACTATCAGGVNPPIVNCGSSCDCTPCS